MINFTSKPRYTLDDLIRLVHVLRAPGGCPWDAAQTHLSIRRNSSDNYILHTFYSSFLKYVIKPLTVPGRCFMSKGIIYIYKLKPSLFCRIGNFLLIKTVLEVILLKPVKCPVFIFHKNSQVIYVIPGFLFINIIPYKKTF